MAHNNLNLIIMSHLSILLEMLLIAIIFLDFYFFIIINVSYKSFLTPKLVNLFSFLYLTCLVNLDFDASLLFYFIFFIFFLKNTTSNIITFYITLILFNYYLNKKLTTKQNFFFSIKKKFKTFI
jgi:hypothetical protein